MDYLCNEIIGLNRLNVVFGRINRLFRTNSTKNTNLASKCVPHHEENVFEPFLKKEIYERKLNEILKYLCCISYEYLDIFVFVNLPIRFIYNL